MLSEILADGVEILAVFKFEKIFAVLLLTKFDGLVLHYY